MRGWKWAGPGGCGLNSAEGLKLSAPYNPDCDKVVDPVAGRPSVHNTTVPFYTQDGCITCGAPEVVAPDLIKFITNDGEIDPQHLHADYHCSFVKQPRSTAEFHAVFAAMEASCIACIRYRGTDARILNLMKINGVSGYADALHEKPAPDDGTINMTTRSWWNFW